MHSTVVLCWLASLHNSLECGLLDITNPHLVETNVRKCSFDELLSRLILPIMQSLSETGEFSLKGKMKYAIKVNLIYYGTLLLIFLVIIIYLIADGVLNRKNFMVKPEMSSFTTSIDVFLDDDDYGKYDLGFVSPRSPTWLRSRSNSEEYLQSFSYELHSRSYTI